MPSVRLWNNHTKSAPNESHSTPVAVAARGTGIHGPKANNSPAVAITQAVLRHFQGGKGRRIQGKNRVDPTQT